MQTASPRYIATERILWLRDDGSEVELSARVGEPYQVDAHTWACPACLDGLDGRYPDMRGGSSLQALNLAVQLIARRLGHFLDDGVRLAWPQDRSPWERRDFASLFGHTRADSDR